MNESDFPEKSALKVQKGIEQPPQVNVNAIKKYKKITHGTLSGPEYLEGILSGNRTILSKAITLIESSRHDHQQLAQQLIGECLPHTGKSVRIGITGVPGVGKSTFIEALGKYLTSKGHQLAVLAIDPSSIKSRGSILGDKTRMEELAVDPNAFIRPSPSAGTLGGVTRKTRETIFLCEAAGFDVIFVETVGVGQSETAVHSMVDFFLLLMLAGAGDELQGIKRGIMEMADLIVIHKADGDNVRKAKLAATEYSNALALFPPPDSGWRPQVETCSSRSREGISAIWEHVMDYCDHSRQSGYFEQRRTLQMQETMLNAIHEKMVTDFYSNPAVKKLLPLLNRRLMKKKVSSYVAAQQLLDTYFQHIRGK